MCIHKESELHFVHRYAQARLECFYFSLLIRKAKALLEAPLVTSYFQGSFKGGFESRKQDSHD